MNFEALALAGVAAFIVQKLVEAIVTPLFVARGWNRVGLFYVGLVLGALAGWATGLNFLPMFHDPAWAGRVLSCLAIGLGTSFIYDLADRGR